MSGYAEETQNKKTKKKVTKTICIILYFFRSPFAALLFTLAPFGHLSEAIISMDDEQKSMKNMKNTIK